MKATMFLAALASVAGVAATAQDDAQASGDAARSPAAFEDVDLEAAEGIFRRNCRACHGNQAQGAASYPALSDKSPEYIAEKLEAYRAGERVGPNSVLMIQSAKDLSDADIAALAVYVTTAFE